MAEDRLTSPARVKARLRFMIGDLLGDRDATRRLWQRGAAGLTVIAEPRLRLLAAACIERINFPVTMQEIRNLQYDADEQLALLAGSSGPVSLFEDCISAVRENDYAALLYRRAGMRVDPERPWATDEAALAVLKDYSEGPDQLPMNYRDAAIEELDECIAMRRELRVAIGTLGHDAKLRRLQLVRQAVSALAGEAAPRHRRKNNVFALPTAKRPHP